MAAQGFARPQAGVVAVWPVLLWTWHAWQGTVDVAGEGEGEGEGEGAGQEERLPTSDNDEEQNSSCSTCASPRVVPYRTVSSASSLS
nr:uncharacterized protein CTRU02_09022 [Colletotrichum truncatum]KAF6789230.1 hypothetical protein CTRU02_09022 [Colletotrichum truncatum]